MLAFSFITLLSGSVVDPLPPFEHSVKKNPKNVGFQGIDFFSSKLLAFFKLVTYWAKI